MPVPAETMLAAVPLHTSISPFQDSLVASFLPPGRKPKVLPLALAPLVLLHRSDTGLSESWLPLPGATLRLTQAYIVSAGLAPRKSFCRHQTSEPFLPDTPVALAIPCVLTGIAG